MSTDGVDVDTATTGELALAATDARSYLGTAVAWVDEQAAAVGDPANDGTLRALLEVVIGGWLRDVEAADETLGDLCDRLAAVAAAFPGLDVELAGTGDGPHP